MVETSEEHQVKNLEEEKKVEVGEEPQLTAN
jgi:hypothetical protein